MAGTSGPWPSPCLKCIILFAELREQLLMIFGGRARGPLPLAPSAILILGFYGLEKAGGGGEVLV